MNTKMANRLKRYGTWGLLLVALLAESACEKTMTVPAYLYVDSVFFSTQYAKHGSSSANITDVWVTVDGKNIGVYELPATIPVLASGEVKVQLQAGIKKNGISSLRPVYPFYTSYICYPHLEKRRCDTLVPSFTYHSSVFFDFKEDFEDAGIKFTGLDSSKGMSKVADRKELCFHPGEVNHYAGQITLGQGESYFEVVTNVALKKQRTYTFLEMDYCVTGDMEVGIYYQLNGRKIQTPIGGVYRTGTLKDKEWKKIYINLTEAVNGNSLVSNYEVYVKAVKPLSDSAVFLFDNIKIVNM
ncbi:MAG: hypothetical protein IKX13_04935 [Bacteroidales bacterium]|jgi:hypothetical protein|nr:hypothetical protein [Bacteroidales bacterium]MBQ2488495.1 hypothetical protein [Bacteroidales bacterium]MBR5665074.1 hypothetical protein [Bacteroidales bacterium]MCR5190628.1 hypothetical protein [Bacteroidales bacterium]